MVFALPKSPKNQATKSWTHVSFQVRPKKTQLFKIALKKLRLLSINLKIIGG